MIIEDLEFENFIQQSDTKNAISDMKHNAFAKCLDVERVVVREISRTETLTGLEICQAKEKVKYRSYLPSMISVANRKLRNAENKRMSSLFMFWSFIVLMGVMFASAIVIGILSENRETKNCCVFVPIAIITVAFAPFFIATMEAFCEIRSIDNAPFCRKMVSMLEIANTCVTM
jgi:hypothetical protein